jgi:hypothetical protein
MDLQRHLAVQIDYMINVPAISWFKSDWMNTIWIFFVIVYGLGMGGLFFSTYFGVTEILKTFPVNMMEVLLSGDTSAPSPIG